MHSGANPSRHPALLGGTKKNPRPPYKNAIDYRVCLSWFLSMNIYDSCTNANVPKGICTETHFGSRGMRLGFDGLAGIVLENSSADPFAGHVFVFRGRRGELIKVL